MQRSFTAVGTGGQEFRQAMVAAVERVVGSVHEECVSERHSSQRKYISVTVGPVWIQNGDQVSWVPGLACQGLGVWVWCRVVGAAHVSEVHSKAGKPPSRDASGAATRALHQDMLGRTRQQQKQEGTSLTSVRFRVALRRSLRCTPT